MTQLPTISWTGEAVRLLDQTRLPSEALFIEIRDEKAMWDAIKRLCVRGAPAIGVAAAFGVYLGVRNLAGDAHSLSQRIREVGDYLKSARPTAVNLAWAVDRVTRAALALPPLPPGEGRGEGASLPMDASGDHLPHRAASNRQRAKPALQVSDAQQIKQRLLDESLAIMEEDRSACRAIGGHGLKLLLALRSKSQTPDPQPLRLLTHCNAGSFATVQYGTALAPIYIGAERGIKFEVFADETRPLLQGSRITAFELAAAGIPVTVICDNMAATVMSQGRVDAVIVGADRIAANGDVANKIGTLGVAVMAKHFGIPFYVAAPTSTIDLSIPTGADIPIEERDPSEITGGLGRQTAPTSAHIYNPAFDITPANLITAIITERGVALPPLLRKSISQLVKPATVSGSSADHHEEIS